MMRKTNHQFVARRESMTINRFGDDYCREEDGQDDEDEDEPVESR